MTVEQELVDYFKRGCCLQVADSDAQCELVVTYGFLGRQCRYHLARDQYLEAMNGVTEWLVGAINDGRDVSLHIDYTGKKWAQFKPWFGGATSRLELPEAYLQRLRDATNAKLVPSRAHPLVRRAARAA